MAAAPRHPTALSPEGMNRMQKVSKATGYAVCASDECVWPLALSLGGGGEGWLTGRLAG